MQGGSDRFRHRNNYEPFSVTVSTEAKSGYVIVYLEVSVTVDYGGEIDFCMVRGDTGSKLMTFRITSNHSDFISYSYKTYGVWEEDYKKVTANLGTGCN
ncbi:hypothetical protein EVAR_18204_1 [Eumeta japonica]|uniref:Uncharacterized protein n=1 Tax=Eumeta variegata TaxID=151549 RepID=A0A4C1UVE1_EUMVA|nr:hypothetical protein EVAR_18204_1 [Eumeta japonica]